jgi:hypothetical protein
MLDNELERIWQNSKVEIVKIDMSKLLIDLEAQLKSFDRSIKNRNRREIVAAVIVIIVFGTGAVFFTGILSKIGLLVGVLYGVLVIYVLRNVKKHKPSNYSLPTKDYLIKHRQYLVEERSLLDYVIYWYLFPPFISSVLFLIGQNMSITRLIISVLIAFGICAHVYFLNKAGVRKSFDPLIKKINETINDIETIN